MRDVLNLLRTVIFVALIVWALFVFVIGIKMVPNDDMYPRMDAGDIMMYYRLDKSPIAQDVVVVEKNGTEYVGRVVASKGDTVDITKDENLVINDNLSIEDKIFYSTPRYKGFVDYPLQLKDDEYFILADKRTGGEDSRYYGPVSQDEIKGTLVGLYRRAKF